MKRFIILCIVLCNLNGNAQQLPNGFSYLLEIDPTIKKELRYFTTNNFIGRPIDGYKKDSLIISTPAAKALKKIQKKLKRQTKNRKIADQLREKKLKQETQQSIQSRQSGDKIKTKNPTRNCICF